MEIESRRKRPDDLDKLMARPITAELGIQREDGVEWSLGAY
jgi:hypothetical protein